MKRRVVDVEEIKNEFNRMIAAMPEVTSKLLLMIRKKTKEMLRSLEDGILEHSK